MPRPLPSAAEVASATPVRRLDLPLADGCRVLPGEPGSWRDGGEERIAEIIRGASDLSSMSEELARHRADWVERYHLSHERANVVRALDIPADAVVLEIGAGCGAITRYLGEQAAVVDALEPTPERAAVARARTRDLPGVELFAGGIEALPAEPAYDLIVIIGVLEYVGGPAGTAPRVAFLREVAARLNEGGAVACAIENQLGVKYLAGAAEDHAGVPFEGIEGYPRRGSYRTFARRDLERIFGEAGLTPDVYHAFPDYKMPRLIYGDALLEGDAAPLAWRAARFPSPDTPVQRPRLASEEHLWRSAVRAGLGGELANSFLVLGRSGARSPWPERLRAVFWSSGRRACFSTATRLVADAAGGARVERGYLAESRGPRGHDGLEHACVGSPYLHGTPLSEILEEVGDDERSEWLMRWRRHAETAAAAGSRGTNIDVGPQNVIAEGDDLVTVDEEWWHPGYTVADAIDRSLLFLALGLANSRAPSRWPDHCTTIADVLADCYRGAGLDAPGRERLAAIVRREAELQAQICDRDPGEPDWEPTVAAHVEDLTLFLERPLSDTPLGRRDPEAFATLALHAARQDAAVSDLHRANSALHHDAQKSARMIDEYSSALRENDATVTELLAQIGERNRELDDLGARYDQLNAAHRGVVESRTWRYSALARDAVARYKARRSST